MRYAEVAVDAPWTQRRIFSYSIPDHMPLEAAHSVWVPFGPRILQGIVFEITSQPLVEETREVHSLIDSTSLLTQAQLELARWIAEHYLASLFDSVALMLPPGFRRRVLTYLSVGPNGDAPVTSPTPIQHEILEYVRSKEQVELSVIRKALGARAARAVEQLSRRGILERKWRWAKPSVGPKYKPTVRLAVDRDEAIRKVDELRKRRAPQQAALLEILLSESAPLETSHLRELGISLSVSRALEGKGLVNIEQVRVQRDPLGSKQFRQEPPPALTPTQEGVWRSIAAAMSSNDIRGDGEAGSALLLHGVTGSGKTELYLRALEKAVSNGKRGLVLVPEIALTPQTINRFGSRFPNRVAVLHSKLSPGEHFDEWWRIKEGEFDVVIGSRSAIYAPQPDLGLIVLDEEHDPSYKQADPPPRYHAREVALRLAKLTGAVVILGSATPDVETYYRASRDEFHLLELPHRIVTNGNGDIQRAMPRKTAEEQKLPRVEIVDYRTELKEGNRGVFSKSLYQAMELALDAQEQIILFLNRRGSATFVQCRECGQSLRCKRCDVGLIYHSAWDKMVCHHCGLSSGRPRTCPSCGSIRISFLGVGTQRVEEEVLKTFPKARVLRWDRDTTNSKLSHEEILQKFMSHEADVLVGTQMIAKGLHMPRVTLVGVISADVGVNLPDFRAGERVFQILTQVAGRAGRGPLGGQVIVQTFNPNHYAILAASNHDYQSFYNQEIAYRRHHSYPPFNSFARLVYNHTNSAYAQKEVQRFTRLLRRERDAKGLPETDILGPVPCFIQRIRGRYRWQVLVRTPDPTGFLEPIALPDRWAVDIDPVSLL